MGYLGMPRRYHTYPEEFQVLNVMSSAGATILGAAGYVLPMIYLVWSMRYGPRRRSANPWPATGLEWQDHLTAAARRISTAHAGRHLARL